jgi:iron complex outermembrane receptor protein
MNKKLLMLSLGGFASGASFAARETTVLPSVIVTGKGEQEDYLSSPSRADVISPEDQEKHRSRFVGDTMRKIPAVTVRELNPYVPALGVRLPANTNAPYYLSTVDGLPLTSPSQTSHESVARLPLATALGGLEVLKGPASTLYGSEAISAVINVRTPDPSKENQNRLFLEGGQRGYGKAVLSSSGPLTDRQGYAAAANYTRFDGWRAYQTNQREEFVASHVINTESGDRIKTTLLASARDGKQAGYLNGKDFKGQRGLASSDYWYTSNPYTKNQYYRLSSEYRTSIGGGDSLTIHPYVRRDQSKLVYFWEPVGLPEVETKSNTAGGRAQVSLDTAPGKLIFGLDSEYTLLTVHKEQKRATYSSFGSQYAKGIQYFYEVGYSSYSPYVNYQVPVGSDVTLDAGARGTWAKYNYNNRAQDYTCDSLNNRNGRCGVLYRPDDRTDSFKNLSPRAGVNYALDDHSAVYANAGEGFKIPAASSLYQLTATQSAVSLKPERGLTYETGYKFDSPKVGFDLSVYQITIRDRILSVNSGSFTAATNAGKTKHEGIEAGVSIRAVEDFQFILSGAYMTNKFVNWKTSNASGVVTDYSKKNEAQAPKQVYNLRTIYSPQAIEGLEVELEYRWQDYYYVTEKNMNKISPYSLVDLRVDYQFSKAWALNTRVVNLFDQIYAADVVDYGSGLQYRPGQPRTIYGGVTYNF